MKQTGTDKKIDNLEEICMELIVNAGDARSCAFEAIESAKEQTFDQAGALLEKARQSSLKAHRAQTSLIHQEACGKQVDISLTLIHGQDHLMTALLAKDLASELVNIYKELAQVKRELAVLKGDRK